MDFFRAAEATLVWADAAGVPGTRIPRWSVRRPLSPVCLPTAAQAVRQTEHCAASKHRRTGRGVRGGGS